MLFIPEYLVKNRTYTVDDQTLYIPLPKNEQISFLQIEISANNETTPNLLTTLMDKISYYEVIADGSKVLYHLEPELAAYIDFVTNDGILPPMGFNYVQNARLTNRFIIPFGRFPFDEEYMLDTGLYDDVQLRIPYAIDGTNFAEGTMKLDVVMYRPMEKLSPAGFIRSRSYKKETIGASVQTIEHDIPLNFPLRYLAARISETTWGIAACLDTVKINFGEGRFIFLDQNEDELLHADKRRYPKKNCYYVTAALIHQGICKSHIDQALVEAMHTSATPPVFVQLYVSMSERVGIQGYHRATGDITAAVAVNFALTGSNPHSCLTLIDGRKDPLWLPDYEDAKIEYGMAAQASTVDTFGQEIITGKLL